MLGNEHVLVLRGAGRSNASGLPVHFSSERTVEAVRQDCSFAKKEESRPALLLVVSVKEMQATR
jgi:hypothetical protein